jgi:hypothetical protein
MITRQLVKSPPPSETHSAPRDDVYLADSYFTDGMHLYRLAGWRRRPGEQPLAELEDCRSLHSTLLERERLIALALHPVALAAA